MTYTYEEVMAKRKELILEIKTLAGVIDGSKEKLNEVLEAVKAIDKANELFGIRSDEEELYKLELGLKHKKNTLADLCIAVIGNSNSPLLAKEVAKAIEDRGYRKTRYFANSVRETLRRLSVGGAITKGRGSKGMYVYSVKEDE